MDACTLNSCSLATTHFIRHHTLTRTQLWRPNCVEIYVNILSFKIKNLSTKFLVDFTKVVLTIGENMLTKPFPWVRCIQRIMLSECTLHFLECYIQSCTVSLYCSIKNYILLFSSNFWSLGHFCFLFAEFSPLFRLVLIFQSLFSHLIFAGGQFS